MKYSNKQEAIEAANSTLRRMKNPELWNIRVWQNLGWHYNLQAANISLSEGSKGKFFALVSSDYDKCGTGLAAWSPGDSHFGDPNKAVENAVAAAVNYAEELLFAAHAADQIVRKSNT